MKTPAKKVPRAKPPPAPPKPSKKKVKEEVLGPCDTAWPQLDDVLGFDNLRRVNIGTVPVIGRPTKLTPAVHQVIITAKRNLPMSDAELCRLVGISTGLMAQWKTQGEKDEKSNTTSRHRDFLSDYRAGAVGFEVANLTIIREAAKKEWRAADRLNEIHNPEKYGKKLKLGLPPMDWEKLTEEQLAKIAAGQNPFA